MSNDLRAAAERLLAAEAAHDWGAGITDALYDALQELRQTLAAPAPAEGPSDLLACIATEAAAARGLSHGERAWILEELEQFWREHSAARSPQRMLEDLVQIATMAAHAAEGPAAQLRLAAPDEATARAAAAALSAVPGVTLLAPRRGRRDWLVYGTVRVEVAPAPGRPGPGRPRRRGPR